MIDFVVENWNDGLTLATFTISVVIGYYQIQHYRAQRPRIKISDIENPTYEVRVRNDFGSHTAAEDLETDDLVDSYYTATVTVDNPGREETTISGGELQVSDTGEQLTMLNQQRREGLSSESVRVGAVDSQEIFFRAIGEVRNNGHPTAVECQIVLRSPSGDVSETVTFNRGN